MKLKPVLITDTNDNVKHANEMYNFYVEMWQDTWKELGVQGLSLHDDFCRFKQKLAIYTGDTPIAFHGYGKFNLNLLSERNHTYFSKLPQPVVEELLRRDITTFYTMEYMCVHKDFRKVANQYLGDVLGGFSVQYLSYLQSDATVTVTRNDRSVNKMCKMYGAYPIFENVPLNNVEVDIMVFEPSQVKDNPNPEVQNMIHELLQQVNPFNNKGVAA